MKYRHVSTVKGNYLQSLNLLTMPSIILLTMICAFQETKKVIKFNLLEKFLKSLLWGLRHNKWFLGRMRGKEESQNRYLFIIL